MDQVLLNKLVYARYRGLCGLHPFHRANGIHHIVPKSAGGRDCEENMIPLCAADHELIHTEGWQNWTVRLHEAQARCKQIINKDIVVGGP